MIEEPATGTETAALADSIFNSLSDIRIAHLELMRIASATKPSTPR